MASIKLGAIITDIAGSIGGTTFRRTPRGIIAYNKQGTQIKSAFAPNSVKAQLGNIFKSWGLLSPSEKEFWAEQALLFQFPNKFGQLVNLTGRQFFTKLNAQLIPVNLNVTAGTYNPLIELGYPSSVNQDWLGGNVIINFSMEMASTWAVVECYPLRSGENAKPNLKSVPLYTQYGIGVSDVNIFSAFTTRYGFPIGGSRFGLNVYTLSNSGFKSSITTFVISYF